MSTKTDQEAFPTNSIIDEVLGINKAVIERAPSPIDLTDFSVIVEDRALEYGPDGFPRYSVHVMWKREPYKNLNGGEIILNYFSSMDASGMITGQYPNYLGSFLKVYTCHSSQISNPWESLMSYLVLVSNINTAAKILVSKGDTEDIKHIVRANSNSRAYFERAKKDEIYKYCSPDGKPSEIRFQTDYMRDVLYLGKFPNNKLGSLEQKFFVPNLVHSLIRTRELSLEESNALYSNKRCFNHPS